MTTEERKRLKTIIGVADSEEHEQLRRVLADHEVQTYGELRRRHGLSPLFLENQAAKYPTVFEAGTDIQTGKPTIRLREGELESRETILERQLLIRKVRQASPFGVKLSTLYRSTKIDSASVRKLLASVPEVSCGVAPSAKGHGRKSPEFLYKWTPAKNGAMAQQSGIRESPDDDLEAAKQKLQCLCEKTHRHLSWLSNFMDTSLVHRVLERWPDDFETEIADLGQPDLIVRNRFSPGAMPPAAVVNGTGNPVRAPQAGGEPALLSEVLDPLTLEELKFKPGSAFMCRRRNRPAALRGERIAR